MEIIIILLLNKITLIYDSLHPPFRNYVGFTNLLGEKQNQFAETYLGFALGFASLLVGKHHDCFVLFAVLRVPEICSDLCFMSFIGTCENKVLQCELRELGTNSIVLRLSCSMYDY